MKNSEINCVLEINADPQTVFEAFTTKKGYQGWWSLTCDIDCKPGRGSFIRFEKPDRTEQMGFRTKEMIKNEKLVWLCFENNVFPSWIGTELHFLIKKKDHTCSLIFTQHSDAPGWNDHSDYRPSVSGWKFFMASLKNYCETGEGDPWIG